MAGEEFWCLEAMHRECPQTADFPLLTASLGFTSKNWRKWAVFCQSVAAGKVPLMPGYATASRGSPEKQQITFVATTEQCPMKKHSLSWHNSRCLVCEADGCKWYLKDMKTLRTHLKFLGKFHAIDLELFLAVRTTALCSFFWSQPQPCLKVWMVWFRKNNAKNNVPVIVTLVLQTLRRGTCLTLDTSLEWNPSTWLTYVCSSIHCCLPFIVFCSVYAIAHLILFTTACLAIVLFL